MEMTPERNAIRDTSSLWIFVVLLLFYTPTIYDLATRYWVTEDQAYSPLVAIAVLYLFWSSRNQLRVAAPAPHFYSGFALVLFGLLLFVVGRSQGLMALEAGSALPVLAGAVLAVLGMAHLRSIWFPIFYLMFLIPLPSIFVDWVTGPLKVFASSIAESILYAFDYPIARVGVTMVMGKYQLLVADACSGLRSIFSLFALGLVYMYLLQRRNYFHNTVLILSIIPIALITNTIRVLMLVLIIYHFGEQVGLGFVHDLSGLLTFVLALVTFMASDSLLMRLSKRFSARVPAVA